MKTPSRIVLVVLALLSILSLTQAQIFFHRPSNLEGQIENGIAQLSWDRPEGHDSILNYNIYRWVYPDTLPQKIGTSFTRSYNDSTIDTTKRSFYAVTAVWAKDNSESLPSNVIVLPFVFPHAGPPAVQFTSTPGNHGQIGQLYQYQPTVVTNPAGHKVCFSLGDAPDSMTIDPSTGAVSWTPTRAGIFDVEIRAQICDSGSGHGKQEFAIFVFPGNAGSVSGHVSDSHGNGIGGVSIRLFDVHMGDFCLSAKTDSAGNYTVPLVPPSTYFIRATPGDSSPFAPQWYNGVSRLKDATPVVVAESASVTINFVLGGSNVPPQYYTIRGTVLDTLGQPIGRAHVGAFRSKNSASADPNFVDHHDDHDFVGSGTTDSLGHYSLQLRAGNYIVGAMRDGFYPQFFDHKGTPLDANVLTITGDTSGINFNLAPVGPANGVLTGTIYNKKDSTALPALVIGFRRSAPDSGYRGHAVFARADSTGQYHFTGLRQGYYVILALPKGDFIPTFYSVSGGTPFHDSATAVFSNGTDSVGGLDIYAVPDSADGLNEISGDVDSGSGSSAYRGVHSVAPIAGAIVTIIDQQTHQPVGSAISGQDGSYLATGLAPGSYSVTFQKPGNTSLTTSVSLAYSNNTPSTAIVNAQINASSGSGSLGLMSIQPRWNLVSLPVTVADAHFATLFPTANSSAFAFNPGGGYSISSVLDYNNGYWVRFPAAVAFTIPGTARTSQDFPVVAGWNLIGSISTSVATASITTSPAGIIGNDIFGYSNGYATATTVEPGQGYWVKTTAAGTVTLSSTGAGKISPAAVNAFTNLNSLTITDALKNSQTLYFGSASLTGKTGHEMPPLPPADAFDARFTSQKFVETIPAELASSSVYPVNIQGASGSITVKWSVRSQDHTYTLVSASGKIIARVSGNGSVQIPASQNSFSLKADAATLPSTFALHQNYPNPFNPTTTLSFDLPTSSLVTLKVFNLLGQEVASLINNQAYEAGSHNVSFNASSLPSGVYFYRLHAGAFDNVKKMVLVK